MLLWITFLTKKKQQLFYFLGTLNLMWFNTKFSVKVGLNFSDIDDLKSEPLKQMLVSIQLCSLMCLMTRESHNENDFDLHLN
jgi:hypothetical protein